jgi:protein-disulfide isomerase-like protein with CxxC motif
MDKIVIYQFTDPTCIWCWGNEPTIRALDYLYGNKIEIEFIMGGLVEDINTLFEKDASNPYAIDNANARIHENWVAASKRHGMPISEGKVALYNQRYTSSFPQNIAYEAAKRINPQRAKHLLRRIREATFTEGKRTSQIDVLVELAAESGFSPAQFIDEYTYGGAQADFMQDRMMCQRNGITGFPSYLIKSQNTEIILGGYQNLTTFHKVIERLSDGHIKPKRVGPSLANVMEFVKRYQSVYPVEIEVAFGLDRARTDLMVDELIASGNILPTAIGDGRRLQPTAIAAKATKNSANKKPTTKSETDKVNNKTMEKKELKATAAKAENAATKSASAEKSATKATTEKCTTKGCGTSKEKGASTKKEKQTVKA